MKVHFGVLEVPYADGQTTGEVAEILEDKYHVMEHFLEKMGVEAIGAAFAQSAKNTVEDMFSGVPTTILTTLDLTMEAAEEIASEMRTFIDRQEMDGMVPGVPTAASLKGVNHRLMHPNAKDNPERPSFRDTGAYQASIRIWTE